jgi:hypothetical protein
MEMSIYGKGFPSLKIAQVTAPLVADTGTTWTRVRNRHYRLGDDVPYRQEDCLIVCYSLCNIEGLCCHLVVGW